MTPICVTPSIAALNPAIVFSFFGSVGPIQHIWFSE